MHNKISNFLVVNYDKIICPKLNKNNELAKKSCKLKTKVTRNMATLSHCKFYEKLKLKCLLHGKKFYETTEEYTTKTCCFCGNINEVKTKKKIKCDFCKKEIDRDLNGAINIMIKNIKII